MSEIAHSKGGKMKDFIARLVVYMDRGKYWLGYLNFLMILFIAVTNLKEYVWFRWIGSTYLLPIAMFCSVIFILVMGYWDIKKGIYKKNMQFQGEISPLHQEIVNNQREILRRLDDA